MSSSVTFVGTGSYPAHITGFFTVHKYADPLRSGSTGAGICITGGVRCGVEASKSSTSFLRIVSNGVEVSSPTCRSVVSQLLPREGYSISVRMQSLLPANYGYGISGSSALSLATALNEALRLGLSTMEIGTVAHVAEVENMTGLGDVMAEMVGGLEVRVSPGAPGIGVARQVPVERDSVVLSTPVVEYPTKMMLTNSQYVERINLLGARALDSFLESPTIENFMIQSRRFWEGVGLLESPVLSVLRRYERAGILFPSVKKGIVFAVLDRDDLPRVLGRLASRGGADGSGHVLMEGDLRLFVSEVHMRGVEWASG
ncbi:MAG: pantoate kinase [Candidatus Verstraetearchaeota archaeon]|nr:pantoate kinase [Candidatus Verstraetearchaeota archaeon]